MNKWLEDAYFNIHHFKILNLKLFKKNRKSIES